MNIADEQINIDRTATIPKKSLRESTAVVG